MTTTEQTPNSKQVKSTRGRILVSGPITDVQSTTNSTWTDSVTKGENLPNWRYLILTGNDATTVLAGVKKTLSFRGGFMREFRKNYNPANPSATKEWWMSGGFFLDTSFGANPVSFVETKASNQGKMHFLQKANAVNNSFQGGVFLGELMKTLHGIRHPAQALRSRVSAYRREARELRRKALTFQVSRQAAIRNAERDLSGLWLEHAFHWTPLIGETKAGCEALAKGLYEHSMPFKAVKGVGIDVQSSSTSQGNQVFGGLAFIWNSVTIEKVIVIYRGAIKVSAQNPHVVRPDLWGFRLADFVPTAWELMPYSWLIDYFTNIGDVLTGWSHNRTNVSWSNRTIIRESEVTRTVHAKPSLWNGDTSHAGYHLVSPKVVCTWRTVNRGSFAGDFVPSLEFELPGFGSKKWLNIAALVRAKWTDRVF